MSNTSEMDWLLSASGGQVREFYTAVGVVIPDRQQENIAVSCFANPAVHTREDRTPSCSINMITGLWNCKGCGQSGNAYGAAIALGYTEVRARELARRHGLFLETAKSVGQDKPKVKLPTERDLKKWRQRLVGAPQIVARLGELKGWTLQGLVRTSVGWDGERLTFAMRTRKLKLVGVVRYLPGGKPKTLAAPGSKRELFPAPEACSRRRPLFVVEGEPAAVSVWSTGHQAVSVPGAGSWKPEWASRLARHPAPILLPDCDRQGRDLAARIEDAVPQAHIVDIAPARTDGFDIGDVIADAAYDGGVWQAHRWLQRLTECAA